MTIITSLIRGADRHSALVDIVKKPYSSPHLTVAEIHPQATIRLLMSIGGLVPVPSDALVTPVTIRVKRRNLRGILSELDAREDGTRELSGEWVVGRKTWQRMQKEWKAAKLGSPKPSRSPSTSSTDTSVNRPKVVQKRKELVVLYIHGGASLSITDVLSFHFILHKAHTICQVPLFNVLSLFHSRNIPILVFLVSFVTRTRIRV